jgi:hypothetical protein
MYAASYIGSNLRKVMYDYGELVRAWKKFLRDFDSDATLGAMLVPPGRAFDITDYKLYKWPGHGIPDSAMSYQAVEGERLKPASTTSSSKTPRTSGCGPSCRASSAHWKVSASCLPCGFRGDIAGSP